MIISANDFLEVILKEGKSKTVEYIPKYAITLTILCCILLDFYEKEALSLEQLEERLKKMSSGGDANTMHSLFEILHADYSFSLDKTKLSNPSTLIRPSIIDLTHKISSMIGCLKFVHDYTQNGNGGKTKISDVKIKEIAWNRYKDFNF